MIDQRRPDQIGDEPMVSRQGHDDARHDDALAALIDPIGEPDVFGKAIHARPQCEGIRHRDDLDRGNWHNASPTTVGCQMLCGSFGCRSTNQSNQFQVNLGNNTYQYLPSSVRGVLSCVIRQRGKAARQLNNRANSEQLFGHCGLTSPRSISPSVSGAVSERHFSTSTVNAR